MADEFDSTFEPELNPDLFEAEDIELEDLNDLEFEDDDEEEDE
jgi:hypothetical protein